MRAASTYRGARRNAERRGLHGGIGPKTLRQPIGLLVRRGYQATRVYRPSGGVKEVAYVRETI